MDPLSLTASLISIGGLLTAVAKSVHKVQNLIHAAREINVLSNEISDLQAVLQNVEHAVQDRQHTSVLQQQTFPNLSPNIQAAKDKLLELDTILRHRLIKTASADGVTKVNRIQWLKERTNVMRLQSELRNIRHNLMTQISALYSLDFSRVHLRLDEVTLVTKDIVDDQRSFHNDTKQKLEKLTEEVAQVQLLSQTQSQTQRAVQTLCQEILTKSVSINGSTPIREILMDTSVTQSLTSRISQTQNVQSTRIDAFSAVRIRTSNY